MHVLASEISRPIYINIHNHISKALSYFPIFAVLLFTGGQVRQSLIQGIFTHTHTTQNLAKLQIPWKKGWHLFSQRTIANPNMVPGT